MSSTLAARRVHALPARAQDTGAVTRRLLRRSASVLLVAWAVGLALILVGGSPTTTSLGHGLLVPGGGWLANGSPGLASLAFVVFVFGLGFWFVLGGMFVPFLWWAVAALLAATSAPAETWGWVDVALPATVGFLLVVGLAVRKRSLSAQRARRADVDIVLQEHEWVTPRSAGPGGGGELTPQQLREQGWLLGLALQPRDEFDGFEFFEQFREGAVRYQLFYAYHALALGQYATTPAFRGYSGEAARNLIEKMTWRKVWSYWFWENLWGNLSANPDPIVHENIMLSGYWLTMLTSYAELFDDDRYDQPGCLEFRWNDRRAFGYDVASIAAAVHRNFDTAPYCLYPCEPNWVFPLCNMIGMAGLLSYDRRHGTDLATSVRENFERSAIEDFTRLDGSLVSVRSSRSGFSVPGLSESTANNGGMTIWGSPTLPEAAERNWILTRHRYLDDSGIRRFASPLDKIDLGNYRPSFGPYTFALMIAAANEMGDEEARDALVAQLERVAPATSDATGHPQRDCSTVANIMLLLGRLGTRRSLHDVVNVGLDEAHRAGPIVTGVDHRVARVARAVTDGTAVEVLLHPASEPATTTVSLERLRPNADYRTTGDVVTTFTTDGTGAARLDIDVHGRTRLAAAPTI